MDVNVNVEKIQSSLMNRWNVCAAWRRPKFMKGNSTSPNGVVMAVFGMSSSATGIWLYARMRLTVEKMVLPCKCPPKDEKRSTFADVITESFHPVVEVFIS